ncbi:P-loop NTPase fold protein [Lentzea sp. NPDC051213]|uniref:P-loop NTPase fold protein n=1 Tax=Lentzea sp. NPDC051213 TaxID=3364126 RepID=UPI0037984EEF
MTSADVPRMELERTIEFSTPIIGLATVPGDPADPQLQVFFDGRPPEIVWTSTGARAESRDRKGREPLVGPLTSIGVDGQVIRAYGADIIVHGTGSTAEIARLTGHSTPVTSLAVFPTTGEPLLVSGSRGGSVRLWNPRTGELIRRSEPSRVSVLVVYAGPDGQARIASGGETGRLRIWNPMLPVPYRIGSVSTRGFSDRVAGKDLLDRSALVSALVDVLTLGDGPTVLTVEGAWGSGKSTVLDFVRGRLAKELDEAGSEQKLTVFRADRMLYQPPEDAPDRKTKKPTRTLVASFNPWRHQSSEQVWAGLAKAVTAAATPAIMPDQESKERYWFTKNAGRVDRRHLQRQLWKRIYSPLLSFAGLGFGLSLLAQLTKLNVPWAWVATAALAVLGVLHTAKRYFWDRASAFLPGELFAGPVTSNAFAGPSADPLLRDPYYQAKAGYLYLVQHDVKALLDDLNQQEYQVVLLIDDLDRCTPRTTAQVFEAINVFLSEDFPTTRFVLGLDTTVVASHVDHAYKELADANIVTHPDDPSPGWTFLRKLVQLPVRLPRTTADNVDDVVLDQLGPVHRDEPAMTTLAGYEADSTISADVLAVPPEQKIIAIEQHRDVRDHLRRRLRAQPEQTVREEKRLLNVWQFYLRVLSSTDLGQAGHLVAVAEIATRWPAYLHRLRGAWQDLADVVDDDVQWGATIAKLGFSYSDRKAAENLRKLLADCDAQAVAGLANRLF